MNNITVQGEEAEQGCPFLSGRWLCGSLKLSLKTKQHLFSLLTHKVGF